MRGIDVTTDNPAALAAPEPANASEPKKLADRDELVRLINRFIKNIQSGTLGVTSVAQP